MTASLLPPNANRADRAIEASVGRLGDVPVDFERVWDPARCPADLLPWLAWGLSIDVWEAGWSETTKRQMIAIAIEQQRRNGSVRAMRELLRAFDADLALHEWFGGVIPPQPYTFEIRIPVAPGPPATAGFVSTLVDQVARVKPARSHFSVAQALAARGGVGVAAAGRAAAAIRLGLFEADYVDWSDILQTEEGEPIFSEAGQPLEE